MNETEQTPISKYIHYNQIDISCDDWINLNQLFSQEELIGFLSKEIVSGHIALPLRDISLAQTIASFQQLCEYVPNDYFEAPIFTRYDYKYPLSNKYVAETNVGNIASDFFQQYNRYWCDSINSPSPVRVWRSEKFLHSALSALWTLKCEEVNAKTLRTCLALRKYIASQFKPAVAKSIYTKFNSKDVLDFSAGWGDRLCGFYATEGTQSYIGIDPNRTVYLAYHKQVKLYENCIGSKKTTFYNLPAEEVSLDKNIVDTVFTSPPYFNIERYTQDENQSFKRYRKIEQWLDNFLFPTLLMSWDALKPNGYMIINISDVYSNHTINKICDPMNDYLTSLGGTFIEGIGLQMSKRPNSGALKDKTGVFVEPIWVWQK